jgi:hypothetical protein
MMHFMVHNKKLVFSITLNVLLAAALGVLIYVVYPQFTYHLQSAQTNYWEGGCTVRTYQKAWDKAYFEVMSGCRRIYSRSGEGTFSIKLFDGRCVTGDWPGLVVELYSGGNHGDYTYFVYELHGSAVREVDVIHKLRDAKCEDLDDDLTLEIVGKDDSCPSMYDYPWPSVVLSFDKARGKFVPDKELMSKPPLSRDQFTALAAKFRADGDWSHNSLRPLSDLVRSMLDLIYSGNEGQAWELLETSWPDVSTIPQTDLDISKAEFKQYIEKGLRNSPFYPPVDVKKEIAPRKGAAVAERRPATPYGREIGK